MIDALTRTFLGSAGSAALDYYRQNALWINSLILLYALLVVFARRNYRVILETLISDFYQKYGEKLAKKSRGEIRGLLEKSNIPWEDGIKTGWFPFVAASQGFIIHPKSLKTLQRLFPLDTLVDAVVKQTSSRN